MKAPDPERQSKDGSPGRCTRVGRPGGGHGCDTRMVSADHETLPFGSEEASGDTRHLRDVLSRFASGVVVVSAIGDQGPVGLTCQSFASLSLDPPLVLFCPSKASRAWPQIQRSGRFCVNVLADNQAWLSEQFAARGADKFAGVDWRSSAATGSPLIAGTLGYLDCTLVDVHDGGDHLVVIGAVLDLGDVHPAGSEHGLTFYRGRYGSTGDGSLNG